MFWKKKDKGEDAPKEDPKHKANGKAPEPARAEPPRQAAPQPVPQPRAPEPVRGSQPQAQAPAQSSAKPASTAQSNTRGPGAPVDAALNARRGERGAPPSPESLTAQANAADLLAQSADPVDRAAAADIAADNIDKAFEALQTAAAAAGPAGAARWRTLGQLAFNVDAGRSKFAYEHLYNSLPRRFWDCIFLARLRGIGRQMDAAKEAALAAADAAINDEERGLARAELGLIAFAVNDAAGALAHAEEAVKLARAAGPGPGGDWALVGRLVLTGDSALRANAIDKARAAFDEGLVIARRLGAAQPNDMTLARGVCEMLEKVAAAASMGKDHPAARQALDEALGIRRKLAPAVGGGDGPKGLAQTLNLCGEIALAAGDATGARAAFDESLAIVRQISAAAPHDPRAQRELWTVMWRMAQMTGAGVGWRDVVATMERMHGAGGLDADAGKFLDEARRRAAA